MRCEMENFDCCSHYVECSDKGICLFSGDEDYAGCSYNKNLRKGIIFYGTRKGQYIPQCNENVDSIIIEPAKLSETTQKFARQAEKIFIDCYNKNFKVNRLGGNGFSYPLTDDELTLIVTAFENKVPFCHETTEDKCIMEGNNQEPANSRVIFSIEGYKQEFVISNYNACLILKRYSDGIARALITKGIKANVEMVGTYAKIMDYPREKPNVMTNVMTNVVNFADNRKINGTIDPKLESTKKGLGYKQVSFFELGLCK